MDTFDNGATRQTLISGMENMPPKKRYIKSHHFDNFSSTANPDQQSASGSSGAASGFQGFDSYHSNSSSRSSSVTGSGYSSSEEDKGSCDSPLDFSAPRNVVRAGVIRHSTKPQMCLAYYYMEK